MTDYEKNFDKSDAEKSKEKNMTNFETKSTHNSVQPRKDTEMSRILTRLEAKVLNIKVCELQPSLYFTTLEELDSVIEVADAIQEFGVIPSIIIDENKNIVAGNILFWAAKDLKLTKLQAVQTNLLTSIELLAFCTLTLEISEKLGLELDCLYQELPGFITKGL